MTGVLRGSGMRGVLRRKGGKICCVRKDYLGGMKNGHKRICSKT